MIWVSSLQLKGKVKRSLKAPSSHGAKGIRHPVSNSTKRDLSREGPGFDARYHAPREPRGSLRPAPPSSPVPTQSTAPQPPGSQLRPPGERTRAAPRRASSPGRVAAALRVELGELCRGREGALAHTHSTSCVILLT